MQGQEDFGHEPEDESLMHVRVKGSINEDSGAATAFLQHGLHRIETAHRVLAALTILSVNFIKAYCKKDRHRSLGTREFYMKIFHHPKPREHHQQ